MITVQHDGNEYPVNHIKSANRQFPMNDIPELSMMVVNRENNPAYPFLNEEEIIVTADGHEWRIKAESEVSHYKNLKAQHILLDLADMEFNQLLGGLHTPRSLLSTIVNGTGFTLDLDDTDLASIQLEDFGRKNVWQCLKEACELLKAEFTVLPGRIIRVSKQLSTDKGKQYRYGYNLKNVTKKTDSTDIVTHVTVNYGEDYAHPATFVSPTASNYKRAYYGDIINDERITDEETARKRAEAVFKDIDISYELDIAQIGNDCELGETIHTIYEPLNDLSITTRILKIRDDWDGEQFVLTDATVGNYVFKTAKQIIQDQIKDAEQSVTEKISETKEVINNSMTLKFHETEQKMLDQYTTVTSEYSAAISLSAREIRTDMSAKVQTINTAIDAQYTKITAEYNSSIKQTAQEIRKEVNASVTSIGTDIQHVRNDVSAVTQTAAQIQSTVSSQQMTIDSQGTRLLSAESNIIQQANQIAQKVSQTDYNGRTITSLINQDPYSILINADKINLNGAVIVNGSISGATDIEVQNNVAIGNALYFGGYRGSFDFIKASGYMEFQSFGEFRFNGGNLYVNGQSVPTSRTSGLGFGYSTAANRLYVSLNGYDVGYIKLE